MHVLLLFVLWLIIICMIVTFVVWILISGSHYSWKLLKPGQSYESDGRKYIFPNLQSEGPSYLLKDHYIREMRTLLVKTSGALKEAQIEWFLTGGSLMTVVKFGCIPMPYDDDIDICTDDTNRDYMFSEAFATVARKHGLQTIYLKGSSSRNANRTGACVRCQLLKCNATLDIFFWKRVENNTLVMKLDGWSSKLDVVYNAKERFNYDDVFPIQKDITFDGLVVNLPRNPNALLLQQYGPKVLTFNYARSLAVSHAFPFLVLKLMWTQKPPG